MEIVAAQIENADLIFEYIKALAVEEALPYQVSVTLEDLKINLLSEDARAEAVLLKSGNRFFGFATFYETFSTTTGKKGIHLDDLYIEPEFRSKGYGKELMNYLTRLAKSRGYARFEWWCMKSNHNAIRFYESLGANNLEDLCIFRMDKSTIDRAE
ncbi:GNAT family N-acetyltransferase [Aliikangiella coralliicola]|uniref:GNAT family N-acetyltransferase n=1 Tax=Aliikangiella coralliicola TaxID=2592383 RepID=A0A545UB24_9GAMM|nr:GNAT family N-acetyltransferase [Aliikangiella coralliicola]TQV86657.1 GNAT family N-acetyltransferase [Aliikangiella coralliicola]